jgi:hypothetical protein
LVKIWVKNCAGRNFRSSSGQLPEIIQMYPGAIARKTCNSRSWTEVGRKYRQAGSTGDFGRKFRSGKILRVVLGVGQRVRGPRQMQRRCVDQGQGRACAYACEARRWSDRLVAVGRAGPGGRVGGRLSWWRARACGGGPFGAVAWACKRELG